MHERFPLRKSKARSSCQKESWQHPINTNNEKKNKTGSNSIPFYR